MAEHHLTLVHLPDTFAICQLPASASLPAWAMAGSFCAVTRTLEELSIVCAEQQAPADGICQRGWRCLKIAGPLDFSLTGVLASLTVPLAGVGVSVFAISTYNTDYLLVQEAQLDAAIAALRRAGFAIA